MKQISIFLAHQDQSALNLLQPAVEQLGHHITGITRSCDVLLGSCLHTPPDLIIAGAKFEDGDGIEALKRIAQSCPVPAIIIARKENIDRVERAMDDHVMAYLADPISPEDLEPTVHLVIRRFEEFEGLRKENEDLREALETRKKLERAKGILMAQKGLTEEEAYLKLRHAATSRRVRLAEVADEQISAHSENKA